MAAVRPIRRQVALDDQPTPEVHGVEVRALVFLEELEEAGTAAL
jgi:hypothetical protein